MKVMINLLDYDQQAIIEIDSRPNVGDGIYLQDFKELTGLSERMLQDIRKSLRFVVVDVVYGLYGKDDEMNNNKLMWIIQGDLMGA